MPDDLTSQPAPLHPPMAPPVSTAQSRPGAWPNWVGVIGVIVVCLGLLFRLEDLISPRIHDGVEWIDSASSVTRESLLAWHKWTVPLTGTGLLLASLLIVTSIGFLKRRRWSRTPALVFAALTIPQAITQSIVSYFMERDIWEAYSGEKTTGVFGSSPMEVVGTVLLGLGLIWNLSLPVFLLIWLNRAKIKQEVAGWSSRDRRARLL